MPFTCKAYCKDQGFVKHYRTMYQQGYVWCKECEVAQPKPEISPRCPCCGAQLRYNPSRAYGLKFRYGKAIE
jgi:hypothetical protein